MVDNKLLGAFATFNVRVLFQNTVTGILKFPTAEDFQRYYKDPALSYEPVGLVGCSEADLDYVVRNSPVYEGILGTINSWDVVL